MSFVLERSCLATARPGISLQKGLSPASRVRMDPRRGSRQLGTTGCLRDASSKERVAPHPQNPPRSRVTGAEAQTSQATVGLSPRILTRLSYPFEAFDRVSKRRPYVTQVVSGMVIFAAGDALAQATQNSSRSDSTASKALITSREAQDSSNNSSSAVTGSSKAYDVQRASRAVIIGGTASIPTYLWFLRLSTWFTSFSPVPALILRVTTNMLTFAPVINSYFFAMQSLLSGQGATSVLNRAKAAWSRVRHAVPKAWFDGCFYWPAVTAVTFWIVPARHRGIFQSLGSLGWQVYLSRANQKITGTGSEMKKASVPATQ